MHLRPATGSVHLGSAFHSAQDGSLGNSHHSKELLEWPELPKIPMDAAPKSWTNKTSMLEYLSSVM
jgi:hypothetical protein